MDPSRALCGVDNRACSAYHAQGGQPAHQQPEEVEEGMKVNVIGDEQDNTVPEEAIALGREMTGPSLGLDRPWAPQWGLLACSSHPRSQTPREQQTKTFLTSGSLLPTPRLGSLPAVPASGAW